MKIDEQYQELQRLKAEINRIMKTGTDFQKIKELVLYLAKDEYYLKLKSKDNQLNMLDIFLNIWKEEKQALSNLEMDESIFYNVSDLDDLERKYLKIQYCGLRVENAVPDVYLEQALSWLAEDKVSGLAIGMIIVTETKKREENILYIAQELKRKGDLLNALYLIQYAVEVFPEKEQLLLEEADIWLKGQQGKKALEILLKIDNPSQYIKDKITELRQVLEND